MHSMKSDWLICVSIYRIQPILSPFRDQPMEWLIACVIYLHISCHPVYYVLWLVTCHNQWDHCFKNLSKRRVPNCLIMHLCRRYLLVYSITCTCILELWLLAHLSWMLKWTFSDPFLSAVCPSLNFSHLIFSRTTPQCQFQPNLAQSIIGWRGFEFVQLFSRGDDSKTTLTTFKILLLQNHQANSTKLGTKHP